MNLIRTIQDALSIARKDLQVIWKDRGQLFVLFLLPLLASSLFGSVYSQGSGGQVQLPVIIVNQDTGKFGEQVADILHQVDVFVISPAESPPDAEASVANSDAMAAIIIPADFSRKIDGYEQATIRLVVNPVQEQYGSMIAGILNEVVAPVVVQGEVQYGIKSLIAESPTFAGATTEQRKATEAQSFGVMMTQVQQMQRNPLVAVRLESIDGARVRLPDNVFAMTMPAFTVMFAFFIVPAMSTELLKEKREGSMRRLLASPVSRSAILFGKMLAYLLIVVLQVVIIFGIGSALFDMPLGNSLVGMALVTLSLGLAATSLGMLVAALSKTERQADAIGMVQAFVLAALGGCIVMGAVPVYESGGLMGTISQLTPHSHALMAFSDLMVKGASAFEILPQVGILLVFTAIFFSLAVARFRYD